MNTTSNDAPTAAGVLPLRAHRRTARTDAPTPEAERVEPEEIGSASITSDPSTEASPGEHSVNLR